GERLAAGDHREAFRSRLRLGQGAQRSGPQGFVRRPDLSDRSLPRQGDGSEHPGAAFRNGIFEPLWNGVHIDHVQITGAETVGVEGRGRFYEPTGALRDMVPNHLFQLLAMIGMEPPTSFDANAVRAKKTELLQAIHPISPSDAVRGQYGAGTVL